MSVFSRVRAKRKGTGPGAKQRGRSKGLIIAVLNQMTFMSHLSKNTLLIHGWREGQFGRKIEGLHSKDLNLGLSKSNIL